MVAIRPNPLRIDVFKNNGHAFESGAAWRNEPFNYSGYLFRFGDTEGTGNMDILAVRKNPLRIVAWRNQGGGFDDGREWLTEPYDYSGYLFFAGDIVGDGRTDIIAIQQNPLRVVTWRNGSCAFEGGREAHTEPYDYSGYLFFAGDIDGDGRTDIIAVQPDPLRVVAWRNNGSGFDWGEEWHTEPYDYTSYLFFAGDIDGNGRTDVIAVQQNPVRIVTWRNDGRGFEKGREWQAEPADYEDYLFTTGDIGGDGKSSILAVKRDPLRIFAWRNSGGAFESGRAWLEPAGDPEADSSRLGLFGELAKDPITILMMTTHARRDKASQG